MKDDTQRVKFFFECIDMRGTKWIHEKLSVTETSCLAVSTCRLNMTDRQYLFSSSGGHATLPLHHLWAEALISFFAPNVTFNIDLDHVLERKDSRSTCMIKNIPNKYSQVWRPLQSSYIRECFCSLSMKRITEPMIFSTSAWISTITVMLAMLSSTSSIPCMVPNE